MMVQYWEPGTQYNYGDVVQFEGHKYKVIQPHRSQSDWAPSVTPALWGRIPEDSNSYQQQQQPQEQYHSAPNPPYSGAPPYGTDQKTSYPENPSNEEHAPEHEKQHWWDDSENKKKLEIGGGLLAGAAAIGAGLLAYKQHEKKKEEHKSQAWVASNWLADARARTEEFRRNGPQGPATWVLTHGKNIPSGAVLVSNDPHSMYSCRVYIDGGIQLGKASGGFEKGAIIGYKNEEVQVDEYEILLGDMRGLRWVAASGKLDIASLGTRPVEGGKENDGTPLYIARAYYKEAVHPGKTSPKLDGAYITWHGKEKGVKDYEVLCYA